MDDNQKVIGCLGVVIALVLFVLLAGAASIMAFVLAVMIVSDSTLPGWLPAVYNLALSLPAAVVLVPLAIWWPDQRYRCVFQSWSFGLLFILSLTPVGLLPETAAQGQALLRTACSLGYILFLAGSTVLLPSLKKDFNPGRVADRPITPVAGKMFVAGIAAVLLAIPWLAYGAFGSGLDTLVQVTSALVMGLAAGLTWQLTLRPLLHLEAEVPRSQRVRNFLLAGFAASTWLLLLAAGTGFPYFPMQILLMFYLPSLGWLAAGFSTWSRADSITIGLRLPLAGLLVGMAIAAPLALVDADELHLLVSASGGEILSWVGRAALFALLAAFFLGTPLGAVLALRYKKSASHANLATLAGFLGLAAACVLAASVYFTTGQPGGYGDGLFVILKDQADVSRAETIEDYAQRKRFVYETLSAHAESSQAGLRLEFERRGLEYTPYYLVNAIQVQGGPWLKLWLMTRPEVDRVLDNPWLRPLPEMPPVSAGTQTLAEADLWNLELIGADRVHEELGILGEGIVVGQSDSGVQGDHPEFASRYRGLRSDGRLENDYNWLDPWYGSLQPVDLGGHGTHTLGTILGQHTGVAPSAQWIGCVNLARNLGNPALYLDCMQFMLAPYPQSGDPLKDGLPESGAHVMNNSWGCPGIEGCDAQAFLPAVEALRSAGVFVVASAGNDGPACETVKDPIALYDAVFSVGALDPFGELAGFSSRGPVTADGSGRTKPDILAPGVGVFSSTPKNTYEVNSGTSMAGPHLVGVVALLWSADPSLIGDIERTEQILIETATPYTGTLPACPGAGDTPSTAAGYGIVNAYEAVRAALEQK